LNFSFQSVDELIETSKEFAREKIRKLINGEVPIKELLLSKSLRAGYAFDRKAVCSECTKTYYELNVLAKKEMDITVLTKKSVDEFISESYSNPRFQNFLKSVELQKDKSFSRKMTEDVCNYKKFEYTTFGKSKDAQKGN
jgi:hypothetical protein